jgi:hypothetical protein
MTPKEKAKELVDKMYSWQLASVKINTPSVAKEIAKQCALIAVDEILNVIVSPMFSEYNYWQEVKKYISYE